MIVFLRHIFFHYFSYLTSKPSHWDSDLPFAKSMYWGPKGAPSPCCHSGASRMGMLLIEENIRSQETSYGSVWEPHELKYQDLAQSYFIKSWPPAKVVHACESSITWLPYWGDDSGLLRVLGLRNESVGVYCFRRPQQREMTNLPKYLNLAGRCEATHTHRSVHTW